MTLDDLLGHGEQASRLGSKKPVERMIAWSSAGSAFAKCTGSGNCRKSSGVTMLTRASVH